MRVLIDECAPRALKRLLVDRGHDCSTVQEAGWSGKHNGELLNLAETAFDVLVTVDPNLRYQQNLAGRKWPSWFFSRPPTVSTIFANTFPPAFWPSTKLGLGQ